MTRFFFVYFVCFVVMIYFTVSCLLPNASIWMCRSNSNSPASAV
jgi:hypothetical protein